MTDPSLGPLGIDPDAERLYRLLLRAGPASVGELAAELGEDAARVSELAGRLRGAGLVAARAGEEGTYAPADPRVALRALTDRHDELLDRIRAQVPVLAELFDHARDRGARDGATDVLVDPDAIAATYVRVQHQAREQFLAFDRPPYVSASENPLQPVVLDRGVRWRAVYAAASFEVDGAWDEALRLAALGEQARVFGDLPVKLAIADRDLALVSLRLDPLRAQALRTESRPLVDALCDLFDVYWARGTPITDAASDTPPAAGPTGEERALLTLIGAGLKDDVIARQLGISTRTLRRRTQDLMTRLDAANRFQAGAEAARRGWM